jgi:hypothetical protein
MSENSDLVRQASELNRSSVGDHVTNVVKAALNAVPGFGGTLASLVADYIPSSRAARLEQFSKDVAEALSKLTAEIQAERIRTDQFAYLLTRVYTNVAKEYQEEKLRAFRNVLVNGLVQEVADIEQERFLSWVEQMTTLQLYILHELGRGEDTFIHSFHRDGLEYAAMLDDALDELVRMNLIKLSDARWEEVTSRIVPTRLGESFIRFISDPGA